eukprot:Nk52_evm9s503 gene=Nk52_evmTU9s503
MEVVSVSQRHLQHLADHDLITATVALEVDEIVPERKFPREILLDGEVVKEIQEVLDQQIWMEEITDSTQFVENWNQWEEEIVSLGIKIRKRMDRERKRKNIRMQKELLAREKELDVILSTNEMGCERFFLEREISDLREEIRSIEAYRHDQAVKRSFTKQIKIHESALNSEFLSSAKPPRAEDKIAGLKDMDGQVKTSQEDLERISVEFYAKLYKDTGGRSKDELRRGLYRLCGNNLPRFSTYAREHLRKVPTLGEIQKAIKSAANGKAVGTDGIPNEFYKRFSDTMAPRLLKLALAIYQSGNCTGNQKKVKVAVIHKKGDRADMGNYRLISLLSHAMKIITSVFLNRINDVIDDVMPLQQNGFVKHRSIQDNVLNVLTAMKCATGGIVTLIDFKKAFDKMYHDYIKLILEETSCPSEFIRWVEVLRNETSGTVKINGKCSEGSFPIQRGVRQGDNISGAPFAIATIPLILGLEKCEGIRWNVGRGRFKINQSDYADDTAILSADEEDRQLAVEQIELFCSISGMELNYNKCIVISFGDKYEDREGPENDRMVWIKNTEVTKYLGYYIGANQATADTRTLDEKMYEIDELIERWRLKALSWKGKATVFSSLLASKLWYWIVATGNSKDVIKRMNVRLREVIDYDIVAMDTYTQSPGNGGFGILKVEAQVMRLKHKLS